MKRVWKILKSTRVGHDLMCWAADSRGGAAVVVVLWCGAHVGLALGVALMVLRKPQFEFILPELICAVAGIVLLDSIILLRGIRVMRNRPNKAPEPTPGAVTPRAIEGTSK